MANDMQLQDKMELDSPAEQTKTAPVFVPAVDIHETETSLTLTADMPGVQANGLTIDLEDSVLTIRGETAEPAANRQVRYREYQEGNYYRQFTLGEVIDQAKISASLKDGVLTLELPKAEKAKPRQIKVKAN